MHHFVITFVLALNGIPGGYCAETLLNYEQSIVRHCESCSTQSYDRFLGRNYNKKLVKLFGSGIPKLLWDKVSLVVENKDVQLSPRCKNNLKNVWEAIGTGEEWAFRLIDSSGKTPPGFLRSTVTSPGDYDECLKISSVGLKDNFIGKYFMVDMFPVGSNEKKEGNVSLSAIPVFSHSPFYVALCLPSSCSPTDVRNVLTNALVDYPLLFNGEISCDTRESISWTSRLNHLSFGQKIAISFILTILLLVAVGTTVDLAGFFGIAGDDKLKCFSVVKNSASLFFVKPKDEKRFDPLDYVKFLVMYSGTLSHILICLEIPLGFFVINQHERLNEFFSTFYLQPIFNESGLVLLSYASGYATYIYVSSLLLSGKLSYKWVIFDRWLRVIPSILCIMALDFIWPILFSGPFYTRVGEFILNKCSRNWWMNILSISNFVSALDICIPHTYFSAMDLQLFVMALFAITLLHKNKKAGVIFCWSLVAGGYLVMGYMAHKHQTQASLFNRNPSGRKTLLFLDYIHMATYTYVPSYFMGLLLAHKVKNGYKIKLNGLGDHARNGAIIVALFSIAQCATILCNAWNFIPQPLVPFVALVNRHAFSLACSYSLAYGLSFLEKPDYNGVSEVITELNNNMKIEETKSKSYSMFKGLIRLSLAIYLSNYFFVRTDFFTERSLFNNSWPHMVKRVISSSVFVIIVAFFFQILFVAPFENLRKSWYKSFDKLKSS